MRRNEIVDVRVYQVEARGAGGDYHRQSDEHWIVGTQISNPMSVYPQYRGSRLSWGIDALGSIVVELEARDGTRGIATGMGGRPAGELVLRHFARFLLGADPADVNRIWDQMYRASLFYGRKGLPVAAISVVDLALWDLLGKLRDEPVYRLVGGATKDRLSCYMTGPRPEAAKAWGFLGGKVPLPHGPAEGPDGLRRNREFLAAHREAVGPDFPLMVDCYMSLDVPYAIDLATACKDLGIYWWEEVLSPDDVEGHSLIKRACPTQRWTTGEHEYTRYGFRRLIEGRAIDILQPDVMWLGGLTELLRVSAMAAAYDVPVVPHASGPYSYHFVLAQTNSPFCEFVNFSPDGKDIVPIFGGLFSNEPVPVDGVMPFPQEPGFGLTIADRDRLAPLAAGGA